MRLNFEIEFGDDEVELLKNIFSCNEDELELKISLVAKAATEEYVRTFLGQKVFTRGQDMKEYRLFLLITHLFEGQIPDENTITTLFQTTNTESKSLLKSVLAKYQYSLKVAIDNSIKLALESCIPPEDDQDYYTVSNVSINIIEEMNKILGAMDGTLTQITRKRSTLGTYEIMRSSYSRLCEEYEIENAGVNNG